MAYSAAGTEDYVRGASVIQFDSAHDHMVVVPTAELLFLGDFRRAGPDLVLSGRDGRQHIIPEYFSTAHRPALVAPNGASLPPDLVELLAGSVAPGQYAQAQPTTLPDPAGKVEKVVGSVTVIRNGVSIALNSGDMVYKSDIIQTGAISAVGISFPDGTALNLVANTRMALNEYSYDPSSTSNVALISLVEGTFSFVAGKVAHSGDMKIDTPVATMGIRGTTGWVQEQIGTISANAGNVSYSFAVVSDYGTDNHGLYDLIDQSGNVISTVSQTGFVTMVTPQGVGQPPLVSTQPMTPSQLAFEQQIIQQVFQTLNEGNNPNPQSSPGSSGSSTPQTSPNNPLQQLIQENGNSPLPIALPFTGGPETPIINIIVDVSNGPTNVVSWALNGDGNWRNTVNWSDDSVPLLSEAVELNNPFKVTINDAEVAMSLLVAAGATLNITSGGSLTVSNSIDNIGTIELNSSGSDLALAVEGNVTLIGGGTVELLGATAQNHIIAANADTTLTNVDNHIFGSGTIGQGDGALTLVNGESGTIEAANGTLLLYTGNPILNSGVLEAAVTGSLLVEDNVTNLGVITADGSVILVGVDITDGTLLIGNAGIVEVASGPNGSLVTLDAVDLKSAGLLQVDYSVTLALDHTTILDGSITNNGMIDVTGSSTIEGNTSLNGGMITVESGVTLTLDNATVSGTSITENDGSLIQVHSGDTLTLAGTDTITGSSSSAINNFGTVDVTGTTTIDVAIIGDGSIDIGPGANLNLNSSDGQTISFSNTVDRLELSHPAAFTGYITGLVAGDVIDLSDTIVTSAVLSGSTLTLTEGDGPTLTYQVDGALAGNYFNIQSDNAGGDALTLLPVPAGWAGDTLAEYYYFPTLSAPYSTSPIFVAPDGHVEGISTGDFSLSVNDSSIIASQFTFSGFWNSATFNGFEVADLSGDPLISSVTIDPASNMVGLTSSDISFDSNAVWVNWVGLSFTTGTIVKLDLTFDPPLDPSQVSTTQTLDGSAASAANAATLTVADGTELALTGTIDNTGTIIVGGATTATAIGIYGTVTLQGSGQIELSSSDQNYVFGDGTLINIDNTISGSGDLGNGSLIFHNAGVVAAHGPYALIIDTGSNPFVNTGTLETDSGTLIVDSPVIGGGSAVIAGGTLEFSSASDTNVSFSDSGVPGSLALDQSQDFTGHISGFGDHEQIDLGDIAFSATTALAYAVAANSPAGTLTVSDGTHSTDLSLEGNYAPSSFTLSSDGHGGTLVSESSSAIASSGAPNTPSEVASGTISFADTDLSVAPTASFTPEGPNYVGSFSLNSANSSNNGGSVDWAFSLADDQINLAPGQTATQSYDVAVTDGHNTASNQIVSVSMGGAGGDSFVFQPGIGAETVFNFNPQNDAIELDHFANAQTEQQLSSLVTNDAHGNAIIDLGHNDSITLPGLNAAQLLAVLQSVVHLH